MASAAPQAAVLILDQPSVRTSRAGLPFSYGLMPPYRKNDIHCRRHVHEGRLKCLFVLVVAVSWH